MTAWEWVLRIGTLLFALGGLALATFDIAAVLGADVTISKRVQTLLTGQPIWSVPLYALVGFVVGVAIHFEVASFNPYVTMFLPTAFGAILGLIIAGARKPGQGL